MAQVITVPDLVAEIRVMSGLRNNQLFSDGQIQALVIDAGNELYDIVEGSYERYFIEPFDFTIASGANVVDLPSNFKRDNSLERNPTTSTPETVDVLGSWLERNHFSTWGTGGRRYIPNGSQLFIFPASYAAGNYRLWYTPQFEFEAPGTPSASVQLATVAPLGAFTSSGPSGPGHVLTAAVNGALTIDGTTPVGSPVQVLVKNETDATANGVYGVTVVGNGSLPWVLTRPAFAYSTGLLVSATAGATNHGLSFELVSSPIDVDVVPMLWEQAQLTLPQAMVPWALYLKVHASIAICTSRKQGCAELESKLQALKVRATTSVKNRTEAPKQAPMTRHVRRAYYYGR